MAPVLVVKQLATELGLSSIAGCSRDAKLLCLQRFTRLFAYGSTTLVLALFLSDLNISDARIGLFMTLTLLGDVLLSFFLTLVADGLGRRKVLAVGSFLMILSGLIFAASSNFWILLAASVFGVISPSGNEIGPFKAIEESTLAQLTPSEIKTDIFAWYTLLGAAGTACGTVVCGWLIEALSRYFHVGQILIYRAVFVLYACLGAVKLVLTLMLSSNCEPEVQPEERQGDVELGAAEAEGLLSDDEGKNLHGNGSKLATARKEPATPQQRLISLPKISTESRSILLKLCLLFAMDSLGSGLVPQSWMVYFFNRKFHVQEGTLGTLFFVTNILSSMSSLVASSVAKRVGLVKTMVFTHLPSAIFLALIPLPSTVGPSMLFLIIRASIASMDQAPRQAFLSTVVLPNERTAVMGFVNVVKTFSQSGGPIITGWLSGMGKMWIALIIGGAFKGCYDLLMLKMFVSYRSREERAEEPDRLPSG